MIGLIIIDLDHEIYSNNKWFAPAEIDLLITPFVIYDTLEVLGHVERGTSQFW